MRHTVTSIRRAAAVSVIAATLGASVGAAPVSLAATPNPVITPDSLAFGDVLVGATSAPQAITLTATADDPGPTFVGATLDGEDMDDFSISSSDCPDLGLQPNQSCTISLEFSPSAQGTRAARLVVNGETSDPQFVDLRGTAVGAASGVAWGSTAHAGPAHTWNGGGALGRTVVSGTQRLHLAYATNRIGGAWASDSGKHAGIYYIYSASGSSWSAPKRLNPAKQHAARMGLATAGSRVYVAWVSQTKIVKYSPTAPRVLYVRVNTKNGASSAWKSTIRLSSTGGRVDYPTIAATGADVYVAWTDSGNGNVRIATSHDRGKTWKTSTLGKTSLKDSSGRVGLPSVAADGSTVIVAWQANALGSVKARVSTDHGRRWGTAVDAGWNDWTGYASTAVRGNRIAIAWSIGSELLVRERVAGTWKPAVVVATVHGFAASRIVPEDTGPPPPPDIYAPTVTLQGADRVGISWAQATATAGRYDLRWAESADGGAHWFGTELLGSSAAPTTRVNDWPSVVWPSAGTRYVVWNGWSVPTSSQLDYRLYLRTGSGTPAGPVTTAARWTPTSSPASRAITTR